MLTEIAKKDVQDGTYKLKTGKIHISLEPEDLSSGKH